MERTAMRGARLLPLALVLVALVGGCSRVGVPGGARAPAPTASSEVRALWVVRTTLTSPEGIRTMVDRADAAGFNTLIVQVRGRGDAYYDGRVEPRAPALHGTDPAFDPLGLVLEEAHARGMEVHAWVNTHLVAGLGDLPSDPAHVVRAEPHLLALPRELAPQLLGRDPTDPGYARTLLEWARSREGQVEGIYTSPADPRVHDRMARIWIDLVERYPVDGMHLDYIRYPSRDFDYSAGALAAFRRWAAPALEPGRVRVLDGAAATEPTAWPDALPGLWDAFRRERVTDLVERLHGEVKARRPEVVVSAAVFADAVDALEHRFQAWPAWLEAGIVDVVAPMAYTPRDRRFREQVAGAVEAAGDPRRVWAGIGVYRNTLQGTVSKIGIAREMGAGGVVLFSYDWAASEGESRDGIPFLERVGRRSFGR